MRDRGPSCGGGGAGGGCVNACVRKPKARGKGGVETEAAERRSDAKKQPSSESFGS